MEGIGTEVNTVIDNLCEKLGTTIDNILPELIRYKQAEALSGTLVFLIIVIVCGIIFKILYDKTINDGKYSGAYEFCFVINIIICIIGVISLIFFAIELHELIMWLFAPKGAAIEYMLQLINR